MALSSPQAAETSVNAAPPTALPETKCPKVSVLVASYNQKAFLKEALDSALAQDYPNFEIVVGDDASTDGSQEVLRAYAERFPGKFTLLLAEKNGGITANCNLALAACTGKYIAFLPHDDIMLPGKLSKQAAYFESHPNSVLCYTDMDVFESSTGETLHHFNSGPKGFLPRTGGVRDIVAHGTFLGASSVMVKRVACPPGGFDKRIPFASDWLFWIETATKGDIGYLPDVLVRYRRHTASTTAVKRDYSEQLMTLGIVEAQYPHLARECRRYRARYLYNQGVEQIVGGKMPEGRVLLWEALRQGFRHWRWLRWMVGSFVGGKPRLPVQREST